MSCELSSADLTLQGCSIQFPRASTVNVPVPSGVDGLLSWDDAIPDYVHTGILPFQLENVVGRSISITGASTPVVVSTLPFGSFRIILNPPSTGYPTVDFSISKSDSTSNDAIVAVHTSQAATTGNIFQVLWPAGSGISVQKTLITEDGTYQLTVTGL